MQGIRRISDQFLLLQNAGSLAIFAGLASAELFALLLYHNPSVGWLWPLSVSMNRFAAPTLDPIHSVLAPGALTMLVLLGMLCAAPVLAALKRNWLTSAVCIHLAACVCVLSLILELENGSAAVQAASVGGGVVALSTRFTPTASLLAGLAIALACLCLLSHVTFFARRLATA